MNFEVGELLGRGMVLQRRGGKESNMQAKIVLCNEEQLEERVKMSVRLDIDL